MVIDGHAIEITSSIGVCMFPDDGDDPDQLLMNADTAMYAAKESGRRRYLPFTPRMAAAVNQRWMMERALRHALDTQSFVLHYQPQVCLDTRRVFGVEALLRWPQDANSFLGPDHFIPIAEQTGLVTAIGEWALRKACSEIGAMRLLLPDDFRLSVNLSPRQLRLVNLPGLVADSLRTGGLRARCCRRTSPRRSNNSDPPACASRSTISAPASPACRTSPAFRSTA
jgi:predicted signal transduction protein with EAL and GGDEF domain